MWEIHLAGSETSFRIDGYFVFQIQLAKHPMAELMSAIML